MTSALAGLHGNEGTTQCSKAPWRRRVFAAALAGTGLLCGLLAAPTPAAAHEFPPKQAKWDRSGTDVTRTYRVVSPRLGRRAGTPEHHAVRIWQELLNEHGLQAQINGVYGEDTERAVRAFQSRRGMPASGRIDYSTARALLERTIRREAAAVGMSPDLLCGHLDLESRLDPAAVGPIGDDLGLGQILIGRWNPGVSIQEALDEDFAIQYMARRDMSAYQGFGDWRIALFDYNYPVGAHAWKRTGRPSSRGRSYSNRVFRGCSGPEFPGEPVATVPVPNDRQAARKSAADLGRWLDGLLTSLGSDWEMSGSREDVNRPRKRSH